MNATNPKKAILIFSALLCGFFLCIRTSEYFRLLTPIELDTYRYPTQLNPSIITPILERLNNANIENDLKHLIDILPTDRYFKSENGYKAAMEIKRELKSILERIESDTVKSMIEIVEIGHSWKQPTIIMKLDAFGAENSENEIIVIGCHIDSINMGIKDTAPGVDDNLSGIVIVLQTIKHLIFTLEKTGLTLQKNIEFHFYAAEEVGSIGSTEIFSQYRKNGIKVVAMLQEDMTGYTNKTLEANEEEHFGLIIDYASESLMNFTKLVIDTYCSIPYRETQCGKICSDHISALMYGYPSTYVLESALEFSNPFIHTEKDTIDLIDFNHMKEHLKLTLSFLTELALVGPLPKVLLPGTDKVSFRYIDFLILMMMHRTKQFVYSVILFAATVGALFNIYLELTQKKVQPMAISIEPRDESGSSGSSAAGNKNQRKRK